MFSLTIVYSVLNYQIIVWRVSSLPGVFVVMVQTFWGFCDGTSKFREKIFMSYEYSFEANFLLLLIKKCRKTKAADTHSEYVIIIPFPRRQWLGERASVILHFPWPTLFILCSDAKFGLVRLIVEVSSTHPQLDLQKGWVSSEWTNASSKGPVYIQHTTNTRDEHQCPQSDSNTHSQQWSSFRPTP